MKPATYKTPGGRGRTGFGAVVGDQVIAFLDAAANRTEARGLGSVESYLNGLPDAFGRAGDLLAGLTATRRDEIAVPPPEVRFLPPLPRPAALLDCSVSPRHLRDSTVTGTSGSPWRRGHHQRAGAGQAHPADRLPATQARHAVAAP